MASDILLESGTSELELLEFMIGSNCYGINVAKIKEILPYQKITPVPNAHPCVEGIFMPRDMLITLVNLARSLNLPESDKPESDMFVVTRFNSITIAFHVHSVVGIHRISWKDINKPDDTMTDNNSVSTGIVKIDNRLIILLDFEKIISDINPEIGLKISEIEELDERDRNNKAVLLVEDSHLLAREMKDCLNQAGYSNVTHTSNGLDAWNLLQKLKSEGKKDKFHCIVTDIEMPVMDGHHLLKLVKNDPDFDNIPVIIFSSLISSDEMRKKGENIGADAQLSKPEIGNLVKTIDKLIL